jgi:hypothetical protein
MLRGNHFPFSTIRSKALKEVISHNAYVNLPRPICRRFKPEIRLLNAILPEAGMKPLGIFQTSALPPDLRLMLREIYGLIDDVGILYGSC